MLGNSGTVTQQKWPAFREDLTREAQIEIPVQINARVRGKILVDANLSEEETKERALNDARIKELIAGKEIVRVVVVPKKLVNIVLR